MKKMQERERARKASESTEEWLWLNYEGVKDSSLREFVAAFPPENLRAIQGRVSEISFARQGVRIYKALMEASPVPWEHLRVVLDHGCGSGRVARLFKDQGKDFHAVDIDRRFIDWYHEALPYVKARVVEPGEPLPYADDTFDLIYQVSVLTHVDERTHKALLEELARVAKLGGVLLLTVSGKRVLEQALNSEHPRQRVNIANSIVVSFLTWHRPAVRKKRRLKRRLRKAAREFEKGSYAFVLQEGHLRRTAEYNYGITFIPPSYIRRNWSRWFEIVEIREGSLNNRQDIVVLKAKAKNANLETGGSHA
jgi:SAM-dependent methyltransferase